MEKRFFLATLLSILILALWTAIFPPPRPSTIQLKTSQYIGNEEVTIDQTALSSPALPSLAAPAASLFETKIETIETPKLSVEFSNVGGTIHRVFLREYNATLPIRSMGGAAGYDQLEFVLDQKAGPTEITYRYETTDLKIRRTYKVALDDYSIEAQTIVQNKTNMSKQLTWEDQGVVLDMSNLEKQNGDFAHDRALFEYVISASGNIERKSNAFKFLEKEQKNVGTGVSWVAFRSRYFCAIMKPNYTTDGYNVNYLSNNELHINVKAKAINVAPGASAAFGSLIFVGPEKSDLLAKYKAGFEEVKRYYRITFFDAIAKIIDRFLHFIHKFVPNWGMSVILISVFIYLLMYPLTLRSMLSMKKMQELQPRMAALREKYKDNPQKMNIEVMELYKKHKINPLGGCLPMLLQMPVFIGLYQVLWRSVSFKGAHFLWIKDLSEPDRLFVLPISLPFIGNEINLLPILMILVMAVQQKLTTQSMGATDPAQIAQQKMMAVIMPIFLGAIFYHFASGLTLYFTLFYAFSALAQLKMRVIPAH